MDAEAQSARTGPGDLVGRRFTNSLNGYDRKEVDELLERVARDWERTRSELEDALRRATEAENAPAPPRKPYEGLGDEVEEMLTKAREVAEGVIARAEAALEEAQDERAKARAERAHAVEDARVESEEILKRARIEGEQLIEEARIEREAILSSTQSLRASIAALVRGVDPLLLQLPPDAQAAALTEPSPAPAAADPTADASASEPGLTELLDDLDDLTDQVAAGTLTDSGAPPAIQRGAGGEDAHDSSPPPAGSAAEDGEDGEDTDSLPDLPPLDDALAEELSHPGEMGTPALPIPPPVPSDLFPVQPPPPKPPTPKPPTPDPTTLAEWWGGRRQG